MNSKDRAQAAQEILDGQLLAIEVSQFVYDKQPSAPVAMIALSRVLLGVFLWSETEPKDMKDAFIELSEVYEDMFLKMKTKEKK
jgi:hypothetical protein